MRRLIQRLCLSSINGGRVFLAALQVCAILFSSPAGAEPAKVPEVKFGPETDKSGEIVLCDSSGSVLRRFVGLGPGLQISASGPDELLIADRSRGQVLRVKSDGALQTRYQIPGQGQARRAILLPDGAVLVAAGLAGAFEFDRSGALRLQIPSPLPDLYVSSAIRLADKTVLLLLERHDHSGHRIFRVSGTGRPPVEIPLPVKAQDLEGLHTVRWSLDAQALYLRHDQGYRIFTIGQPGVSFSLKETIDISSPFHITLLDSEEVLLGAEDFFIKRLAGGKLQNSF